MVEKVDLLYRQSYHGVYGSMVVAVLWASLMWTRAPREALLTWLGLMVLATAIRVALFITYFRAQPTPDEAKGWRLAYVASLWTSSALWGFGTLLVMPKDSLIAATITFTFLVGLAGAALAAFSLFLFMLRGVMALVLVPFLLWLMWQGDTTSVLLSVSGFWFLLTAERAVRVHNTALDQSFRLAHQLREATRIAEWHADRDALTGLRSRRAFTTSADSLVRFARRHHQPVCMLLIDIDSFKRINDQHGHAAGDRALLHVAQCLQSTLRGSDIASRLGGDEFAVLLPDTTAPAGREVAEKLRAAIEGTLVPWSDSPFPLSVSIGLASTGETSEILLKQADAAMYHAKRAGKNRVSELPPT